MKTKFVVLLISLAVCYSSCSSNKSGENVKVADSSMQKAIAGYKMVIVARLSVKPDKITNFTEAAKEIIEKSNKESGCTSYQLYQDPYTNTKFVFVEEYKDQAAVDAHFAMDYFAAFGPKIADFITGPPNIKVFSVAKEITK
jgi:quinol monooxygenase YgiN